MLKSLSLKRECFAFAILMSLAIAFGFGHKQILAAVQDGQVNMGLWTHTVADDENGKKTILITDYSKNDSLKNIVTPNTNDFLADDTFRTKNPGVTASDISEVSISKAAMQKAIANANKDGGAFSISQTEGEASKTIVSGTIALSKLFADQSAITKINLTGFKTSGVNKMNQMFSGCRNLTNLTFGDNFDTSSVTDMSSMFSGCLDLTSLDLSNFDTSSVTDMSSMFSGCPDLTSLDLSNFDTNSVTNMSSMFSGCLGLTSLTFGEGFNTTAVTNMRLIFTFCSKLTSLTFSGDFNTTAVTNMLETFRDAFSTIHKVTFDAGEYIEEIQIVKNKEKINLPTAPERDGYTFKGWYKETELENEFNFESETITKDTTLYAKWTENPTPGTTETPGETAICTVTFNTDGGSKIESQKVTSGNKITKPSEPTKDGYTFEGWYKEAELKNKFDFESETITGNTTLYAKWIAKNNTARFGTDSYSWNTSSDSSSSSSYSETNSQDAPIASLSPNSQLSALSQQIPVKLQTRAYLKGYGDGTIKPEKGVTNAELATMLTNLVQESDEMIVQNPVWYEGSILYVLKKGIMKAEDCAKPNAFATVAQINSALDNVLRVCGASPSTVNSLDASAIYGTTNTNVSLSENSQTITRGQLANMIKNKFGRSKKQVSTKTFSDLSPNHPYYEAIMDAVQ